MSQRNQHLTDAMLRKLATTTPKQVQTTWCFGEDWQHAGGAIETFNQQPCSPESCHSVTLARVLLFVKAAPFFAKKGHCSNLIFGAVNTLAFWTPRSGPPQFSTWMSVSSFRPFVVSWFLANFCSSWVRSERHVATPKTGLPHAPTRGFGAPIFGLACY